MELSLLLRVLVQTCESLGISYLITGSVASTFYGDPRFTNDVDVVVDLPPGKVADFCAAFPAPDYYCSLPAAEQAVGAKTQFNILQPTLGLKVDVIIASASEFDQSRLSRGVREEITSGLKATIAAPEDVIIKKLEYFKMGGSEKHLRDIAGIIKVQRDRINQEYLAKWVARLGLIDEWQLVKERLDEPPCWDHVCLS